MSDELQGILKLIGDLQRRVAHLETLEESGKISGALSVGGSAQVTGNLAVGGSGAISGDISVDGSITKSSPIGCQLRRSSTQAIPHNTWTAVLYNVTPADWDPFGMWTWKAGGESKVYVKVKGHYRIRASVGWDANAGGGRRITGIRLNGTVWVAQQTDYPGGNSLAHTIVGETLELDPTAGDYVEICVYQDSGASINIQAATVSNLMNNTVIVERMT